MQTQNQVQKNLQPFWSVAPSSGNESHIFTSEEAAVQAVNEWNQELDDLFERWEKGEYVSLAIDSSLESDLNGGCYQSFRVHPAVRPGGINFYDIGKASFENWESSPGVDKIKWGNPATQRFQSPQLAKAVAKNKVIQSKRKIV